MKVGPLPANAIVCVWPVFVGNVQPGEACQHVS